MRDQIKMMEVRLVADRLAGGKCHHLSGRAVLEAVNEILRSHIVIDGKTELEFAIQALEDIASPIGALQRYADKQGRKIDGPVAVQLSKDPGYLKGMASDALATLRRQPPRGLTWDGGYSPHPSGEGDRP